MRLLLIEDDELLGQGVYDGLKLYGYTVDWIKDGKSGDIALKNEKFDVVLLDVNLPKMSGFQLLSKIRERGDGTPVLILTARELVEDRVKGLDLGGDDYLVKPFDLDELCARIRALQRRSSTANGGGISNIIKYANIILDPNTHSVMLENIPVNITRREFALLQKLLENIGRVLSRECITQNLYGWDDDVDSNALEVHIHNLRKKFGTNFIRTIRGIGYMLDKKTDGII